MDEIRREVTRQKKWRRWLTVFIVISALFNIWGVVQNRSDSQNNQNRIVDIQASRVQGCKNNYEALRQVFLPFFPPQGHRTVKQKSDLAKFNTIINRHIVKCAVQVAAK